jgi:Transcriptional regulators
MLFLPYQVELEEIDTHIYKYICTHYDKVIYMRIRELAYATNVSTSTILRFCKKFECEGYSEFKFKLRQYIENSAQPQFKQTAFNQVENISFLKKISTQNFQDELHKMADIIIDSDLLVFMGLGASGIAAQYGAYLFNTLVSLSMYIDDPLNTPLYHISDRINQNICFIIISVSGEQEDIIDFIENEKISHNKVISITNTSNSTLARVANANLSYYISDHMLGTMNLTSQVPTIAILECLSRICHNLKNSN